MAVISALVGQDGAMSTDGDPAGPPASGGAAHQPRPAGPRRGFTERERAINALAYPVAGTTAAAVVVVIVVALVDPSPGRHVRGLLILLALVGLLAAACGWVRTVWHGPTGRAEPEAPAVGQPEGEPPDATPGGGRQIVRRVE